MEWNPETLRILSQCFLDIHSPLFRRRGLKILSDAADKPNYGLCVLRLVAEPSVDEKIRQYAAVNFKNHIKARWMPTSSAKPISVAEKKQIKNLIIYLMITTTKNIQAQLSESLSAIGNHDFVKLWPDLLPKLRSSLETAIYGNDFASVNSILAIVNSLFKKFRYLCKSDDPILLDLNYCLDNFAAPLLTTVETISERINAAAPHPPPPAMLLRQLIEAQRLCFRIFYSLIKMDLPQSFVDNADKWMNEFKNFLTVRYPSIEDSGADDDDDDDDDDGGVELVDGLRAAVCDNICHYMEHHHEEEVFEKYLSEFVEAVCSLLVVVSASPKSRCERLTVTAIKFLKLVSTSSVHHVLFAGDEILQQITQSIVIPTVMLRDEDEVLFEMNYVEFIRRDRWWDGSDIDIDTSRRRIACELVKGIAGNYKQKITERVSTQISSCLALFAENPAANWKYMDCAIYLVISLATKNAGGASVSTDLVDDVQSFFISLIVPELQGQDVNAYPMLKSGALKFFTAFRVLIPKTVAMAHLGDVVRFLGSDVNVVHSYAAGCIEKLLLVKDNGGVQARYTAQDIGPNLPILMSNLLGALEKPGSEENQYIMRCIMCVLQIADDISPEVASPTITGLTKILNRVCPKKNPVFNHCLFEAVAAIVPRACERNPFLVSTFETCLLPSLQMMILGGEEVTEFVPYAFQLLAQLVDLNRPPPPSVPPPLLYIETFDIVLTTPDLWYKSANVPALVRFLQSFLQLASSNEIINSGGRLVHVIGIISRLVSSPSTVEQGLDILNPLIENHGYDDIMAKYMNNYIWGSLFTRLLSKTNPRFVRCLIIFMSLFLVKHGIQTLMVSMNYFKGGNLFRAVIGQFWIPFLKTITTTGGGNNTEVKLSAVASSKLLCESESLLLDPANEELWGKLLDGIVTLFSQPKEEEQRVEDEDEPEEQVPEFGCGYRVTTFVRLQNAGKREVDPLKEIQDPKHYSLALLSNLFSRYSGRFPPIITKYLSQPNQAALLQLCNSYNLSIV